MFLPSLLDALTNALPRRNLESERAANDCRWHHHGARDANAACQQHPLVRRAELRQNRQRLDLGNRGSAPLFREALIYL